MLHNDFRMAFKERRLVLVQDALYSVSLERRNKQIALYILTLLAKTAQMETNYLYSLQNSFLLH